MRIRIAFGALFTLLVLAGCSGESGGGSDASAIGGASDLQRQAAQPAAAARSANGSAGYASDSKIETTTLIDTRALIRTADLKVTVKHGAAAQQADRAADIALDSGGEVYSDDRGSGWAQLTLKVPPDALSAVLAKLADLGDEQARQTSTEDVTGKVADVDSRVDSARESILRLRTLYADATKVSDVIAIEQELATRQAELESLEAQQRALSTQTSQATVRLSLTAAKVAATPPPKPEHRHGVGGAFASGWDAFTGAAAAVTRGLAAALPFLILVALVGFGARVAWLRRPRSLRPATTAPDPS